jgi:RNA polymerase sigma factor (sigma-70 family)
MDLLPMYLQTAGSDTRPASIPATSREATSAGRTASNPTKRSRSGGAADRRSATTWASSRIRIAQSLDLRPLGPVRDSPSGDSGTATTATASKSAAGRLSGDEVAVLVKSAAAGHRMGWDALVREFGGLLWAIARAYRLCESDAADVVQVTWLRLLEHLHDLTDPARVGSWLATTARRECLRVLRSAKRNVPFAEDVRRDEPLDALPGDALLIAERDRALWRSFGRLRGSDQALLRLLMADPRPSYDEISLALDMPIGSIGPTRARALERLQRELGSEGTLALLRP